MDSLKDLLQNKARAIDFSARKDDLSAAQQIVDGLCAGIRVIKIQKKSLYVRASSAPLASNIRLSQMSIINALEGKLSEKIERLVIRM